MAAPKDSFIVHNEWMYYVGDGKMRLVLPKQYDFKGTSLIESAIEASHKVIMHRGFKVTYADVSNYFYWKGMSSDIKEYVESYDTCQRVKYSTQLPPGLLIPLHVPQRPWKEISIDFLSVKEMEENFPYGSHVIFGKDRKLSKI